MRFAPKYPTAAEAAAQFSDTLADLERRGIHWHSTRFAMYRKYLFGEIQVRDAHRQEVQAYHWPRYWEAESQVSQLVGSRVIWGSVPADVLEPKLRKVLKGDVLPPSECTKPQEERNTLLELATATLLHNQGLSVALTSAGVDVAAFLDGLPRFSVECKRPQSRNSLPGAFEKAMHQLQRRCPDDEFGLVVIGMDRMIEVRSQWLTTADLESLQAGASELADRVETDLRRTWQRWSMRERVCVPLIAILLARPIWVQSEMRSYILKLLRLSNLEDSARIILFMNTLSQRIGVESDCVLRDAATGLPLNSSIPILSKKP